MAKIMLTLLMDSLLWHICKDINCYFGGTPLSTELCLWNPTAFFKENLQENHPNPSARPSPSLSRKHSGLQFLFFNGLVL